jgi:hypothetical protein
MLIEHKRKEREAIELTMGCSVPLSVGSMISISGSNGKSNGTFQVTGVKSGRISTSRPNISNVPRSQAMNAGFQALYGTPAPVPPEVTEARLILRRRSVRPGKRHSLNFRILDHGPDWQDQQCNARFKVIRWIGPNPPEWERVGWRVSEARFADRKEATQVKRDLLDVAEVMDS